VSREVCARRPRLTGGCARPLRRAFVRLRECALVVSSCLQPQWAHADRSVARSELVAARAAPAPAPTEQPPVEALELRVSYRAPRDCPSSGYFIDALQRHVAAGGEGAIDADVDIRRRSGSEYELVLRLRVAGVMSESAARAASCAALLQLAALNASMARTSSPLVPAALAAPPPPLDREPSPAPEASPRETEPIVRDAGTERATAHARRGMRAFVLGEVRTAGGMLPRQAWGRGVTAGVARDIGSLRLSATFWDSQRGVFAPEDTSPMSLDFEQQSLELSPCAGHALTASLRIDGCALLATHRVRTNPEGARLSGSIGAAALATLSPWRGLRVELEGGLSTAIARPSFGADALRHLYEPDMLQPSARIALGWEFGGGT